MLSVRLYISVPYISKNTTGMYCEGLAELLTTIINNLFQIRNGVLARSLLKDDELKIDIHVETSLKNWIRVCKKEESLQKIDSESEEEFTVKPNLDSLKTIMGCFDVK